MKLSNFEWDIDPIILERGSDYFQHDHVEEVKEINPGFFIVEVVGSDYYTVEISLYESDVIVYTSCDCPYEFGDHCKHQVAAFYALRQHLKEYSTPIKESNKKQKVDLKTLLSNLPQEELIDIILNVSREYPEVGKRLLFNYAPSDDEIASSKQLIKQYINQYKKRGFIAWDDVYDAVYGAEITLEKAKEKIERGDTGNAALLCLVVLPLVIDMLDECDDSSGIVGGVIEDCLETIYAAVSASLHQTNSNLKEEIFSHLMKEALHQRYDGWIDWRIDLFRTVLVLCDTQNRRKMFETQLDKLLETTSDDTWSAKYVDEQVKLLQLELIRNVDGDVAAFQFIQENIRLSPFRKKAIKHFLKDGNYQEVLRLCEEGKEVDHAYQGLVDGWKKYQLQAYQGLGDIQKQRELMLELLYANEYEYYAKLKELYPPNKWNGTLREILETFEKRPHVPSVYIEILKEESLTEKLLQYCWNNLASIQELYPYLIEMYEDEVNQIFIRFVEMKAESSSNRSQYRQVCRSIKQYEKVSGSQNAQLLIERLKQKYVRRPAFIDELGKLNRTYLNF